MNIRRLTNKQQAVLDFIISFIKENQRWPKYKHFENEFGYRSPNSVTQNLKALERKNYIMRDSGGYSLCESVGPPDSIPIMGEITAGCLQEAVEAKLGSITLEMLFPNLDRIFALRVNGQSMSGVDINDGDYVLLIDDDIPSGGIGAILYNGETSLKRIFLDGNGLRLEPANSSYDGIIIEPSIFEEVRILGRYVGHINRNGLFKTPVVSPSRPIWDNSHGNGNSKTKYHY